MLLCFPGPGVSPHSKISKLFPNLQTLGFFRSRRFPPGPRHRHWTLECGACPDPHRTAGAEADAEARHWRLLTTLPADGSEAAARIARWYAPRWKVEVLHRVLKTGCRVETRQLRTMDRPRPMIALDLVIACSLMSLAGAARSRPEAPAAEWLEEAEIQASHAVRRLPAPSAPSAGSVTAGAAVAMIAKLGGHLGRKNDGPPGPEVIWRGLKKQAVITEAWRAFSSGDTCG